MGSGCHAINNAVNTDSHNIFRAYLKESWQEVFSGDQPDRWGELTDMQRDLIHAYMDKVRQDFNDPHARQDIRLIKVTNDATDPENLKHVHIHVPDRPVHVVELNTKHDELYVPHAHPHGGREQVKLPAKASTI